MTSRPPDLDPLTVLACAAVCTTRVRLGTRTFVAPWSRPVLLARSLMSLDVVNDGRLTVGLVATNALSSPSPCRRESGNLRPIGASPQQARRPGRADRRGSTDLASPMQAGVVARLDQSLG